MTRHDMMRPQFACLRVIPHGHLQRSYKCCYVTVRDVVRRTIPRQVQSVTQEKVSAVQLLCYACAIPRGDRYSKLTAAMDVHVGMFESEKVNRSE